MPIQQAGTANALRAAWATYRAQRRRQRDVAETLGVSEAELVASACGEFVTRLNADCVELLLRLPELSQVMALTRNAHCVHEKIGRYENLSFEGRMGLALGEDIDLRLFLAHWQRAYAVREPHAGKIQNSLQFYDACGHAVHKVFLRPESHLAAFELLVEETRAADQTPGERVQAEARGEAERPDAEVDRARFQEAWGKLTDTHHFFGLLKKFKVTRPQAMRLAGHEFAAEVPVSALRRMLQEASERRLPIMVFVGNPGCIQIHTGPITNIKLIDDWVNVLDSGFNLHLKESAVHAVWLVRKPTSDGVVTSLEAFDSRGELIASFFGQRKPGIPEMPQWRELAARYLPAGVAS